MKKSLYKYAKYFVCISLVLFIFGGQPLEFGKEKTFFHGYLIPKPVIRIGLGINLSEIKISSLLGIRIYEVNSHYKLITEDVKELLVKGHNKSLTEKFVIQVAQSKDRKEAKLIAQELRTRIENKVYVRKNTEERVGDDFQILVGDFITRDEALNFIKKLNQKGIKDTWIFWESITEEEPRPFWIHIDGERRSLNDDTILYFIPNSPQSYLSFNDRDYRGIFVIHSNENGLILTNILNLEDYLKGVVPSELSPYDFPRIEAQKAQAVAARTYAIKNLKLNDDIGFDLWDTPKSQFYTGVNAEHPLSTMAVDLTKGEVAVYGGELINALYTSTCGGRTENAEEVFGGLTVPYLQSTDCDYEIKKALSLESKNSTLPVPMNKKNISEQEKAGLSSDRAPLEAGPVFDGEEGINAQQVDGKPPPLTDIVDKRPDYLSWDLQLSREELEKKINQYYPIGELIDIVPQRKGVSGRVVELFITGTESQAVVKGLRIRRVLGLRDTLFVIDRKYNQGGRITHFTFHGKGWGHGVGLCQVGAYGLAREGMGYLEILKKYYYGIKIEKIY